MDLNPRPSTPNTVIYEDDLTATSKKKTIMGTNSRPNSGNSLAPPPPPQYTSPSPDRAIDAPAVGAGRIWTVEGEQNNAADNVSLDEDEETRILLEKEFDDFYEDHVHKSAGPVVFVSKMLGMLPVIWTEDESESECKSYFNLYTFIIFIGWVGLATITGLRVDKVSNWPGDLMAVGGSANATNPLRFLTKSSVDTYFACTWIASLVALLFGVFKCRSMAEVLFGLSETDAQLELQEKHYDKIKRKSLYWIAFLGILLAGHAVAFYTVLVDANLFDILILLADVLAHTTIFVLDLQFLHLTMVLCKRYRLVNKILLHITKPWKTFRNDQPSNYVLQNILQYRFDQIFEPSADPKLDVLTKSKVPLEMLIKGPEEQKISREEENTFILQLDILRGIHADLASLSHEVSHLLGFQILVHLITSVIFVVMFGYFFSAAMLKDEFYWPYLVLCLLSAVRIFLIGHWGQVLEQQSRQPFMTICQMSTVDGSPRLERQVQKLTIQMNHQCPTLKAAGYFNIGRNMILKTIGMAVIFTFFMVQFEKIKMT